MPPVGFHDAIPEALSLTGRSWGYIRPGLAITAEHDQHSRKVQQRRREQTDPSECGYMPNSQQVRDVSEQVRKTHSGDDGEPDRGLPPTRDRNALGECKSCPLPRRPAQEGNVETRGSHTV